LVLAMGLIAAVVLSLSIVEPWLAAWERTHAAERVRSVVVALDRDLEAMDRRLAAWAARDDTVAYVDARDPGEPSSLIVAAFQGLDLDALLVVDSTGVPLWSGEFDRIGERVRTTTSLLGGGRLERLWARMTQTGGQGVRGVIGTARGPLLVAVRPVPSSAGGGRPGGAIAAGRLLSADMLGDVAALQGLTITSFSAARPDLPAGARAALDAQGQDVGTRNGIVVVPGPTDATLRTFAVLDDLFGTPLMILRADVTKGVAPAGRQALWAGIAFVTGLGLALILVFMTSAQRMMLAPLRRLTEHLRQVTDSGDLTTGLPDMGRGELGRLTEAVNGLQQRIARLAYFDTLTGLPNRRLLKDRAEQLLRIAHRSNQKAAILFLDLDGFKAINDGKGHATGDSLLQAVGVALKQMVRESDTVGRFAGDEFIIVMHNPAGRTKVEDLAGRVLSRFRRPFQTNAGPLFVGVSIGIALYPDDGHDLQDLIGKADAAMYQAKGAGGDRSAFLNGDRQRRAADTVDMAQAFREAIFSEQLRLVYQPQVDLSTGSHVRHEALLRWTHPQRGLVRAEEFIHLADSGALYARLDAWVLRAACELVASGGLAGPLVDVVAVNVSTRHLADGDLVDLVRKVLGEYNVSPRRLVLEIGATETIAGQGNAIRALEALRAMGVAIAIDGFGTGRTALKDLQRVPTDIIKIHRGIIRAVPQEVAAAAITRAIVTLGREMGVEVVAEGVETDPQLAFLLSCGVRVGQGHLLGVAT